MNYERNEKLFKCIGCVFYKGNGICKSQEYEELITDFDLCESRVEE